MPFSNNHIINIIHGESKTRLYSIWNNIKHRCLYKNFKQYDDYQGRGITICPEWTDKENGYINFKNWALSNGYQDNLEIDRINNNLGYDPENCRWVTHKENMRNTRWNKIKSIKQANEIRELYKTNNYTQQELAGRYNVKQITISNIITNKIWI